MKRSVLGRVSAGVLAFAMIFGGMGASAMAQSDQEVPREFVNLEGMVIEGETRGAGVMRVNKKQEAIFEDLNRIKKRSLLPKLRETSEERALSGAN